MDYRNDSNRKQLMPNISDSLMHRKFTDNLDAATKYQATQYVSQWEDKFVDDIREKYESRDVMMDMGLTPWNPTARQWNTLAEIAERYRKL